MQKLEKNRKLFKNTVWQVLFRPGSGGSAHDIDQSDDYKNCKSDCYCEKNQSVTLVFSFINHFANFEKKFVILTM